MKETIEPVLFPKKSPNIVVNGRQKNGPVTRFEPYFHENLKVGSVNCHVQEVWDRDGNSVGGYKDVTVDVMMTSFGEGSVDFLINANTDNEICLFSIGVLEESDPELYHTNINRTKLQKLITLLQKADEMLQQDPIDPLNLMQEK